MKQRIHSIDIVRGLIMIIMTLDHSRDFLHYAGQPPLNMQTTTGILFFTRWITHFCAPTFVFLAGVSAYLAGQRRTKRALAAFLLKRGMWLILSDLLIISLLFTFDLSYHYQILEVLWATGFGMILLALLIHIPLPVIAGIGAFIILGHNVFDYIALPKTGMPGVLSKLLLTNLGVFIPMGGGRAVAVLYAALPWDGVLLLGYGFGSLYKTGFSAARRQRTLLAAGASTILLFIVLRLINAYGDPSHWSTQRNAAHTLLSFLNATKQPPALLFLSMTLGPVLILLSLAEKINGRFGSICRVYGNTPYFYFILHILVLRLINMLLIAMDGLPFNAPSGQLVWQADGFGRPLWAVYLFWIFVVVLLYLPCRWFGRYKQTHTHWWLSYL